MSAILDAVSVVTGSTYAKVRLAVRTVLLTSIVVGSATVLDLPARASLAATIAVSALVCLHAITSAVRQKHVLEGGVERQDAIAAARAAARLIDLMQTLARHIDRKVLETQYYFVNAAAAFDARQFSRFWDAIESAAHTLDLAREDYDIFLEISKMYADVAATRSDAQLDMPPDPKPLLIQLGQLVRAAQTDFEFAAIYEQRRSRDALKTGFASIDDTLRALEVTLDQTMRELNDEIGQHQSETPEPENRERNRRGLTFR